MANVLIPKKSTVAAKVPTTSDLALGEIAINHADQKLYARHPVSGTVQQIGGGDVTIDTSLADLLTSTSGTLSADDPGADRLFFWDDSAGRATHLEVGSGLQISGTTLNNTSSLTGTGSVDNAILRADGTGGSTLQTSDIVIDDATTSTQNNVAITNQHAGQTDSALVLTPKGTGAFILGPKPDGTAVGGNARGDNAICMVSARNAATQVSSGAQSVAIGYRAKASGISSIALGNNTASNIFAFATGTGNTASGQYSTVMGRNNAASGNYSFCTGAFSSASAESGFALGGDAKADRLGMFAYAYSGVSGQGTSQRAWFVLRQKTTTNSAVELTLNGATAGATNRLTIPSGKIFAFTINISGVKSDGSAVAHYLRQYCLKNVAGTTSEVYAPVTIGTDNAAGTSIALSANDTNDALKVEVTGIAAETWRWVASVDAVEIAYGA